jgi:hypothetical protein
LIELRLRPAQGTTLQAETLAMCGKTLPLLRQVLGWDVTEGLL